MRRSHVGRTILLAGWLSLLTPVVEAKEPAFPLQAERILFLGDSITHSGLFIARIETVLRQQQVNPFPEIINLGLGSETCSGLSEPDHPFPRPDVHERLERALDKLKPDVVVACYGMNDGIYHPFSEDRFLAYRQGIDRLIEQVHLRGAKLILMTPPPFDPVPLRGTDKLKPAGESSYAYFAMYESYDEVLAKYAEWILEQISRVEMVIDLHTSLSAYVAERRKKKPDYTLAPDGIHPNDDGHRILAEIILRTWGIKATRDLDPKVFQLVKERTALLHAAWLSEVGHQRPGIPPGLPIAEATKRADELDRQIQDRLTEYRGSR